ncbi:VWA domain-containing protein [Rhodobacterales bacterium 56_14_T64]|nr:VWA domain-containing protein [Rhodobacterales bacterium 56_14_T64]
MLFLRPFVLMALLGIPVAARACDLALVLAVDVSGSVDANEYRIQMDGLAEGLRDGVVAEALVRGKAQVLLMQWSGATRQEVSIPWVAIEDFSAVEALAKRIETVERPWRNYSTAIGEALQRAVTEFDTVADCKRRVIDLSGDGTSNEGLLPGEMGGVFVQARVMVNALAIEQSDAELTSYFYENVIHGDGAFVATAVTFTDYPSRIRMKLLREVARQTAALSE